MRAEDSVLIFSSLLFCIGVTILLNRKNLIHILIGIELMLNSANINLIFFSQKFGDEGRVFALFILLIAVCEAAVGLAIFLRAYRFYQTSNSDDLKQLGES